MLGPTEAGTLVDWQWNRPKRNPTLLIAAGVSGADG